MIVKLSKSAEQKILDFKRKTGAKKYSYVVERLASDVIGLSEENRHYLHDKCMERYDALNSIDVDDGDFKTDEMITENMRQMLYLSFLFKEGEDW